MTLGHINILGSSNGFYGNTETKIMDKKSLEDGFHIRS